MTKETIPFSDFQKLDMRIGTIVAAEIIPEADKLLKLVVDVGEESPRQVVSGIREYFPEPEELVGRQFPFVLNIEPRTIRGHESQGMILAVGGEAGFAALSPGKEVSPGSPLV